MTCWNRFSGLRGRLKPLKRLRTQRAPHTPLKRGVIESKRETRKHLAALPFSEKLILLEKLRDRSLLIASSPLRRTALGRV